MKENIMIERISAIGLDIAKRYFQVHAVDEHGRQVVNKKLSRDKLLDWLGALPACEVAMEACATSHYWAREIARLGHQVKLLPPVYVKPYVKRQKNDRVDAAAIAEASGRPGMRFVSPKTEEQQAVQALHRSRELLIKQRTQAINALRAHLAELGYVFKQGDAGVAEAKLAVMRPESSLDMHAAVRSTLQVMVRHIESVHASVLDLERQIRAWHNSNEASRRIATIPGIGAITASAIVAAIGDGRQFRRGRDFAAWLGMVPSQHSSGGKDTLGRITRKGNSYIRRLLVMGSIGMLRGKKYCRTRSGKWAEKLVSSKPAYVAAAAMAAKSARVAWTLLARGGRYETCDVAASAADAQALAA